LIESLLDNFREQGFIASQILNIISDEPDNGRMDFGWRVKHLRRDFKKVFHLIPGLKVNA
jgi:hypothetical protein